ncbi:MAG: SGNH/GDSL hydrolase family protein [Kiritimatiellales bacterium]
MKKIYFVLSLFGVIYFQCCQAEEPVFREPIEWCDIWVSSAHLADRPRVLLVGDSITKAYYSTVEKKLEGLAYCARLATSACIADPAFQQQLEGLLSQYNFDVIHFNNGLHQFSYNNERYQRGYKQALETIKRLVPSANVILALSTPLQSTGDKAYLTPRVDQRNQIVQALAQEYGFEIDDLYSLSKGHPEYYKDPVHYKPETVVLQGNQVASVIQKALTNRK